MSEIEKEIISLAKVKEALFQEKDAVESRVYDKLDSINDKVATIAVLLENHTVRLDNQDKDLAELKDDMKPIKHHMAMICGILKAAAFLFTAGGAIFTIIQVVLALKGLK